MAAHQAAGRSRRGSPISRASVTGQEAARIIREAEGRSDLLLEKTAARLEDIQREIDGLKLKRKSVETSIEATIQTLRNTLEYVREQEARELIAQARRLAGELGMSGLEPPNASDVVAGDNARAGVAADAGAHHRRPERLDRQRRPGHEGRHDRP